jgi:membrane associated rhomboid family serine protease
MVLLAAEHPDLSIPPDAQEVVDSIKRRYPKSWAELQVPHHKAFDSWDARVQQVDDPESLQSEMNLLCTQFRQAKADSITEKYAFVPAHPTATSYLTANFLHGGWLHIIGNLWFLWLAGFVLEDFWGRPLYLAFYLLAGAAAMQFDAWMNPGSLVPTLGASGAVAALMGAFLVRFPKMRIEMLWFAIVRFRFKAPAYWLLPAWLFMEVFYGSVFGQSTGVAHWAHVGGFAFGALGALGLRFSGLEQKANRQIEATLTLTTDHEIQEASSLIDQGHLLPATTILTEYLSRKSDSVDACNLLLYVYRQTNDESARAEILAKLCAIHLKASEEQLAWKAYEEFLKIGSQPLPVNVWLDICRAAEKLQYLERALSEYENLARTYAAERQSVTALIACGRLCLKRLNQPQRALEFFEAADKSPVPHLDWEQSIMTGIKEAKTAMGQKAFSAAAPSQR